MKKIMLAAITIILVALLALVIHLTRDRDDGIPASNDNTTAVTASAAEKTPGVSPDGQQNTQTPEPSPSPDASETVEIDGDILYSEDIDLDGDGSDEKVQIYKTPVTGSTIEEYEGILAITSGGAAEKVVFVKKPEGLSGLFKSVEFRDMDGDGTKDVFIIIPDYGASFTLNFFHAYSYKLKKSLAFTHDDFGFDLAAFADEFKFRYEGSGNLRISNSAYGFEGMIDLKDNSNYSTTSEDSNKIYERSWVDPTPVDLGENSKLVLEPGEKGGCLIRMPVPVFGQATVDLIGEIDLLFGVDSSFNAQLRGFELFDFNVNEKVKAGSITVQTQGVKE